MVVRVPARGVVGDRRRPRDAPGRRVRGLVLHADAHLVPRARRRAGARRRGRASAWNAFTAPRATRGAAARAVAVGRDQRRRSVSCSGSRRSSTSSRTRPGTSASSATTSVIRPTPPIGFAPRRRRVARAARPVEAADPHARARRRRARGHRARAIPGALLLARVRGVGDRRVAAAPPPAPAARRRARRRARARAGVVGADLRDRVVLPAALGVGARRAHAVRDRLDRGRARARARSGPGTNAPGSRRIGARRARARCTLVASVVFSFQASSVTVQTPRLNESLGALVGPTADALTQLAEQRGSTARTSSPGCPTRRRSVRPGFGLLNELDRRGFDVRAEEPFRPGATRYHVIDDAQAHARGAPRDRTRHRELAPRLALHRGRLLRPAHRRRAAVVRPACTGRSSATCNETGLGTPRAPGRQQPVHARARAERAGRAPRR